jgi:hypothetical protein
VSTPIERAAEALHAGVPGSRLWADAQQSYFRSQARAVFASIDVDELAHVIEAHDHCTWYAGGWTCGIPTMAAVEHVAQAVIAWLTSSTPDTNNDLKETR